MLVADSYEKSDSSQREGPGGERPAIDGPKTQHDADERHICRSKYNDVMSSLSGQQPKRTPIGNPRSVCSACEPIRRLCDVQIVTGRGARDTASNARAKADKLPGRHSGASPGPPNSRGWSFRQAIHCWTRWIGDDSPSVPVLT
jgi:hypothetical protein